MASQECFLGNQVTAYSPGNLLYSSNIPQLTVPRLTLKWTTGRTLPIPKFQFMAICYSSLKYFWLRQQ